MKNKKYIFVSGGVISGVGKGTITASLSRLLEDHGYKVSPVKIDMYLNVDAGTIRPQEHGEVFVLKDGLECDQDLGNYERFLGKSLTRNNYMTSGAVYLSVITQERAFKYKGEDVEAIPHVTNEIIDRIKKAGKNSDIVVVELGGTVGEYQNGIFFEASRILKLNNPDDVINIHVAYLITPPSLGEMKTKPVQQSVKILNSMGIQPDFIVTRSDVDLDQNRKEKLALHCNVPKDHVISSPDIDSIYKVPVVLERQKMDELVLQKLNLKINNSAKRKNGEKWRKFLDNIEESKKNPPIKIGLIGKYFKIGSFSLSDVYISVLESIKLAAWAQQRSVEIVWIDGEEVQKSNGDKLRHVDGIIVPGGFGARGIEGVIKAIQFARTNEVPYLGLCYGMQLACIEFARHVCGIKDANTTEINPKTANPVIHVMPEQEKKMLAQEYGGSMRLGSYEAQLKKGTITNRAYRTDVISERHRHRYEFNNKYRKILTKNGLIIAGTSPDDKIVEIIELRDHPFFVGVQFHPEFQSSPIKPHPLFVEFIKKVVER
ncbi:MAG TPA: CTP synthase [bacterium]|nr:CTP synthase [bacterium]